MSSSKGSGAGGRSIDRLRHHYDVERELAGRLRQSTREQRVSLFGELYGELFRRVPDHPRNERLNSEEDHRRNVAAQMRLLGPWLRPDSVVVEFAPGNAWLSYAAAEKVKEVIAVDISDQRDPAQSAPPNFRHVVYDGYHLDLPDGCAEVVFSYQFLEHLHPDDVGPHFDLAARLLKPGGVYVFDTPHRYTGPHDISRWFSDTLDCFHFQEWTHLEMRGLLKRHGFPRAAIVRGGKGRGALFAFFVEGLEWIMQPLPHKLRRLLCGRLFPSVAMAAERGSR